MERDRETCKSPDSEPTLAAVTAHWFYHLVGVPHAGVPHHRLGLISRPTPTPQVARDLAQPFSECVKRLSALSLPMRPRGLCLSRCVPQCCCCPVNRKPRGKSCSVPSVAARLYTRARKSQAYNRSPGKTDQAKACSHGARLFLVLSLSLTIFNLSEATQSQV